MADRDAASPPGRQGRPTTVERAFELARSGRYANVQEIAATLKRERYESVDAHLAGPSIRQSLRLRCESARTRSVTPPQDEE
jgi:hypothetical protein